MPVFPGQFSVALMMSHETVSHTSSMTLGKDFTEPVLLFVGCCAYVFNMARTFGVCRPAGVHHKKNLFL